MTGSTGRPGSCRITIPRGDFTGQISGLIDSELCTAPLEERYSKSGVLIGSVMTFGGKAARLWWELNISTVRIATDCEHSVLFGSRGPLSQDSRNRFTSAL